MPSDPPPPTGPPVGVPAPEDLPHFATPSRLHPLSVVIGVPFTQIVQALFVPAAALLTTGARLTIGLVIGVVVVGSVVRILAWQRFRFSFDGQVLRISSGVVRRGHRSVDVGRIQQVEIERPLLQRLTGTATLHVETAGGSSEPAVRLAVLDRHDAEQLRHALRARRDGIDGVRGHDDAVADDRLVLALGHGRVMLAAVTGVQLFVLPALVGGALQLAGGRLTGWIEQGVDLLLSERDLLPESPVATGVGITIVVLALAVTAAAVVGLVRDGGFRLERSGTDLVVRRGLVGTHDSTVPLPRVQLVEVVRNPLRRLLGFASLRIHSAGGAGGPDRRVTIPLVPTHDVPSLLTELLPALDEVPELVAHPAAARRRALWRWLRPSTTLAVVVWTATHLVDLSVHLPGDVPWVTVVRLLVLAMLPVAAGLALADHRHLAHGIDDRIVVTRRGALSSTLRLAPLGRVQAVTSRANPFQRHLGLQTLTAHLAGPGGDLEVLDVGDARADDLRERLVEHAAASLRSPTGSSPGRH